jgi:hypothetical protein
MNLTEFSAQLEEENTWRTDEIRFFQNQCEMIDASKQDQFRRALILLLYSHFEGFVKFALVLYVEAINESGIYCSDASYAIAAAALEDVFHELREAQSKCTIFKKILPDDTKLHRIAREREFIERSIEIMSRVVKIPDGFIDLESNLKPVVLRKNLYKVGLPHDQFKDIEGKVDLLLEYRNKIAHGRSRQGITDAQYLQLRDAAFRIMKEVSMGIVEAFIHKIYLRVPA